MVKQNNSAKSSTSCKGHKVGRVNYVKLASFAERNIERIITEQVVCEASGMDYLNTYEALKKIGYYTLTHRDYPGVLTAGQLLLWPEDKDLPVSSSPRLSTGNNTSDRRLQIPDAPLTRAQLSNQLFEGDCLDILPFFPDYCVDMILCDLPYGTTQNKWDSVIPLDVLWEQYKRILKPNGVVALTSQGIFTAKLILSNEDWFKYKLTWIKSKPTNFLNAKKQPLRKHEDICIFYKNQPIYNPEMTVGEPYDKGIRKNQLSGSYGDFSPSRVQSNGQRYPTDVVYFKTSESEGTVWHPTQKPVALGRYLIRTFTKPGNLVLDNTFGSGSFLVAAVLEKRDYVGIEQNQDVHLFKQQKIDYLHIAQERIANIRNRSQEE